MGLLKHFVLPLLVTVHAFQAFQIYGNGKDVLPQFYAWPDTKPLSTRELHLVGIIGSTSIMLTVSCLIGVLFENAHYRGIVVLLETIYFTIEAYDAYSTGYPISVKLTFALVCAISLMIHSMEPGIFTKDKSASTTKKSK